MILNPAIEAKRAAIEAKRAAPKDPKEGRGPVAANVRDYLEALVKLAISFNALGVAVRAGTVVYMGVVSTPELVRDELATSAWDDAGARELAAALDAALSAEA